MPPWEAVPVLEFVVLPLQTFVVVVRVGLAGAVGLVGVGVGLGVGLGVGAGAIGVAFTTLPQLASTAKANRPFCITTKACRGLLTKETLGGRTKKTVPLTVSRVLPAMSCRPPVMAFLATK